MRQREQRIGKAADIRVELRDVTVKMEAPDRAAVSFRQNYFSGTYSDASDKTLEWQRIDGKWLIVRETARVVALGQ